MFLVSDSVYLWNIGYHLPQFTTIDALGGHNFLFNNACLKSPRNIIRQVKSTARVIIYWLDGENPTKHFRDSDFAYLYQTNPENVCYCPSSAIGKRCNRRDFSVVQFHRQGLQGQNT